MISGVDRDYIIKLLHDGMTYADMGKVLGVTRQRIHQILKGMGLQRGRKPPAPVIFSRAQFKKAMYRHLSEAGYMKCDLCLTWVCDSRNARRRCTPCNRVTAWDYYHNRGGAAKQKQWRDANPDKIRANSRNYHRRKKLAKNEKSACNPLTQIVKIEENHR